MTTKEVKRKLTFILRCEEAQPSLGEDKLGTARTFKEKHEPFGDHQGLTQRGEYGLSAKKGA